MQAILLLFSYPAGYCAALAVIFALPFVLTFFGFFSEVWRTRVRYIFGSLAILAVLGVGILFFSNPGQEPVDEIREPERNVAPVPAEPPTLAEILKAPWDIHAYPDWPIAVELARLCEIAYWPPVQARAEFTRLGFESETIVAASMAGYVLAMDDTAVIVFRGTDDSPDWLQNASIFSASTRHGSIHTGFNASYQPLHGQVAALLKRFNPKRIWIAGHSLGGALAVVSAFRLVEGGEERIVGIVTFGQPMVVASDLREYLRARVGDKFVHFANEKDPVPKLITPFVHFGKLIWRSNGKLYRSIDGLAFGDPKSIPEYEPLTPQEFEKLRAEMTRAKLHGGRQEPERIGRGILPFNVDDHYMDQYVEMLKEISSRRGSLEGHEELVRLR